MTDRPLTLHQHEARAFREGRQTQFRRVLKPQPYDFKHDGHRYWNASGAIGGRICISDRALLDLHRLPDVGDRLWCRETALYWRDNFSPLAGRISHVAAFRADGYELEPRERWSPPNHMPRRCSRTALTVTEVRLQKLQEISEADAVAQGSPRLSMDDDGKFYADDKFGTHYCGFAGQWAHDHGADAWAANPWVVAYTVDVTLGNIDGAI